MHILVLADRDWTHPQGGGSGANLREQAVRWLAAGNRVTIVCCSYPGAAPHELDGELEIHRIGGRSTVFPRAIWRQWRGLVPDADVVLEIVNGVTFLTPLWLRTPRLVLVHHIRRRRYLEETGPWRGRLSAFLLETLPLRLLYRNARFLTGSDTAAAEIAEHGVPAESIEVVRNGVDDLEPESRPRAVELRWDETANASLAALEAERTAARPPALWSGLARSDFGRAGGLAAAVIASNVVALVFTVVFARLLGASGYGSLAALLSAFIILMVPGSALQIAVAREISAAGAGGGAGVRHWISRIALGAVAIAAAAVLLRDVLGAILNVDEVWAAAAVPVCAFLWMIVSVERGALQGYRRYRVVAASIVGEALARLGFGVALVLAGLDVTGAFLATPLALVAIAALLARPLARELPQRRDRRPLRDLLAGAWIPVVGLTLLFALQEVHVIVVKHEVSDELAGSYGVAAVAAKAIIWVAVGLGMYLLPEAARRSHEGVDPRPVLMRTLTLIALAALPMVAIYAVAAEPLLRTVFGPDLTGAADALPWLGLAMALLACAYLSVQYLLALGRSSFIWVLAVAGALEVGLLALVGANVTEIAVVLFGLQAFCATTVLALSLRARPKGTLAAERTTQCARLG